HTTTAEAITGLKFFAKNDLTYHVGGGTELRHSTSSPDWRFYAGINWQTGTKPPQANLRPLIAEVPTRKPDDVIVIRDIFFKFDSDEIASSKGFKEVENIASVLKKRDFSQVIVEGHTCSLGSQIYNRELSRK